MQWANTGNEIIVAFKTGAQESFGCWASCTCMEVNILPQDDEVLWIKVKKSTVKKIQNNILDNYEVLVGIQLAQRSSQFGFDGGNPILTILAVPVFQQESDLLIDYLMIDDSITTQLCQHFIDVGIKDIGCLYTTIRLPNTSVVRAERSKLSDIGSL